MRALRTVVREKLKYQFFHKTFFLNRLYSSTTPTFTILIRARYNNFFSYVYNKDKQLLFWSSGGLLKLKGKNQGSRYAGKSVMEHLVLKMREFKKKKTLVILHGKGPAKRAAIKVLKKKKRFLNIFRIINLTKIPYNGCRRKKQKR